MNFEPTIEFRIEVDDEGVCRIVDCSVKVIKLTPHDLGALLTAVLKAVTGEEDTDQQINVSLN